MSDVRLTATNPEDSSVVPVACNAKGELLLEEPIAPPEFDGNLDGDLTVSGNGIFERGATFGYRVSCGIEYAATSTSVAASFGPNNNGLIYTNGDLTLGTNKITLDATAGSASFRGEVTVSSGITGSPLPNKAAAGLGDDGTITGAKLQTYNGFGDITTTIDSDGTGASTFAGDVVVGSRGKKYMLVEQGGLCHMVEQKTSTTLDLVEPAAAEYPKLRDVFAELNVIEKALEEVMEKLRMTEPDGWPVWDGSDNS